MNNQPITSKKVVPADGSPAVPVPHVASKRRARSKKRGKLKPTISPEPDFNSKEALDRKLDLALEETFPASDPISIKSD